jgi:hypothetical protein
MRRKTGECRRRCKGEFVNWRLIIVVVLLVFLLLLLHPIHLHLLLLLLLLDHLHLILLLLLLIHSLPFYRQEVHRQEVYQLANE